MEALVDVVMSGGRQSGGGLIGWAYMYTELMNHFKKQNISFTFKELLDGASDIKSMSILLHAKQLRVEKKLLLDFLNQQEKKLNPDYSEMEFMLKGLQAYEGIRYELFGTEENYVQALEAGCKNVNYFMVPTDFYLKSYLHPMNFSRANLQDTFARSFLLPFYNLSTEKRMAKCEYNQQIHQLEAEIEAKMAEQRQIEAKIKALY